MLGTPRAVKRNQDTLVVVFGKLAAVCLMRSHNQQRGWRARNDTLDNTAHAPLAQAALPMSAEDDQADPLGLGKICDQVCCHPFSCGCLCFYPRFLKARIYLLEVYGCLGFIDLPVQGIN